MSVFTNIRPLASRYPFRAAILLVAATSLAGALFFLADSLMASAAASIVPDTIELTLAQQSGTVITVDATTDTGDALPGDGLCNDDSGACTLRAAIEEANALEGTDTIAFGIPGTGPHIIQPVSPLPAIEDPVVIDATTEPDYASAPIVVLDGSQAGERASGLTLTAGSSTVRGLALYGFDHAAIHLLGAGNHIEGNYVGIDTGGSSTLGNGIGVLVEESADNIIGGTAAGAGNVISGNEVGVYFYGPEASDNHLQGNIIGLDASGSIALGNEYGVRITGADGNLIGGTDPAARNLISSNRTGIYLVGAGASGNRIQGNYIGPDASGSSFPGRQPVGIYVNNVPGNEIGGNSEAAGNVIFGGQVGVILRGSAAHSNRVRGNLIGTDAAGIAPDTRMDGGVLIVDARNNIVGGTQTGEENRISARMYGVRAVGPQDVTNQVTGNVLDVLEEQLQAEEKMGSASLFSPASAEMMSGTAEVLLSAARQQPTIFGLATSSFVYAGKRQSSGLLQTGVTFTVDSTGDGSDANAGDGICDDGSGSCTLRAAIGEANATVGSDTIAFNISGSGPHTIQPASQLPAITEAVTIDGTTEPDFVSSPVVELDGSLAGAGDDGLVLQATTTVRGLVINRFDDDGIDVASGGSGSFIEGNYIGTNAAGSAALGNLDDGIDIAGASNVTVGGTTSSDRNLISGNGSNAIAVSGSAATGNTIQGNYLGTDASGTSDLGNGGDGIYVTDSAASNTIGGSASGAGNLISGNDQDGIELDSASGNVIEGNQVGTNAAGTAAVGNTAQGIRLDDAPNNTVGGTTSGAGNLVSGNGSQGIALTGSGSAGNQVLGNMVGTDVNGTAAIPNANAGIYLYSNAGSNTVGGTTAAARNVVSGNSSRGIVIDDAETMGNTVQGNYVGTDVTGSLDLGNSSDGIYVTSSAAGNTIGGSAAGAGNVVSGNGGSGVYIRNSSGTTVQGNLIGVAADSTTALGNDGRGVRFYSTSTGNQIGGTGAGEGNIIANNGQEGVDVNNNSNDNPIQGNAIYANDDLGIDLGDDGVDTNDAGDVDTGPNNKQNYPVLSSAHSTSASTTVTGTLHSITNTQFTLDFYASDSCDSSGYGEGERYLGSDTVTTDSSGDASFTSALGESTGGVAQVTATATDPDGNTSEFSACVQATYNAQASLQANFSATPTSGEAPLELTFTDSSTPAGTADAWTWDFGDGATSSAQNPTHTYTALGAFTVTLTVTATETSQSDTLVRSSYISVTAPPFTDTWETITTTMAPPVEGEYAMTYDGGRDVVVLYGGKGDGWPYEDGTWEFDGTDWSQVTTAGQPNAVYGAAVTYDSGRNVIVLFGGSDAADEELAETWEYDGAGWMQVAPTTSPPARTGASLVYDTANQTLYLFGGNDESTYYNDLWEYDGTTWTQVSTGPVPPVRTLTAMAYHAGESSLYLFGGRDSNGDALADLWAFDPVASSWSEVVASGPGARYAHSLAYDVSSASLVLSGGAAISGDTLRADTWHYQVGGGWTEGTGSGDTPATAYHGAVYDETDHQVILFQDGTTLTYR